MHVVLIYLVGFVAVCIDGQFLKSTCMWSSFIWLVLLQYVLMGSFWNQHACGPHLFGSCFGKW